MPWHSFALLGCFLVWLCSCLGAVTLRMSIFDGLNSRRSPGDQIPISNERLQTTAWWLEHFARHGPFSYYRVLLPDYRREFPSSRAPAWYVTCVLVMYLDAATSLLLMGKWLQ